MSIAETPSAGPPPNWASSRQLTSALSEGTIAPVPMLMSIIRVLWPRSSTWSLMSLRASSRSSSIPTIAMAICQASKCAAIKRDCKKQNPTCSECYFDILERLSCQHKTGSRSARLASFWRPESQRDAGTMLRLEDAKRPKPHEREIQERKANMWVGASAPTHCD